MNRKRNKQIVIRVSAAELEAVKRKVLSSGMSQQEYLLRAILGKKVVNTDGIKAVLPQLGHIGANLNQIAKAYNQGAPAGAAAYEEVMKARKEVEDIWQSLRQSLPGQASVRH